MLNCLSALNFISFLRVFCFSRYRLCPQFAADLMEPVGSSVGSLVIPSTGLDDEEHSPKKVLVELRNGEGPGDGRTVFPPTLTARQRRRAHEIAERLGLGHIRCVNDAHGSIWSP